MPQRAGFLSGMPTTGPTSAQDEITREARCAGLPPARVASVRALPKSTARFSPS
jgi:hypothetical protein